MFYGKKQKNIKKNYEPFFDWLPHPIAAYVTLFGKPDYVNIDYFREINKKKINKKYLIQDLKIILVKKTLKCEIYFSNNQNKGRRDIEIEGSSGNLSFRGYSKEQLKYSSKSSKKRVYVKNKFTNPMNSLLNHIKFKRKNNQKDLLLSIKVIKILLKITEKINEFRK